MLDQLVSVGFTALDRFSVAIVIGVGAGGCWLLARDGDRKFTATGISRLLGVSLLFLALSSVVILILRTAVMADVPPLEAWPYITKVLTHSDFGVLWILRMLAFCGLIIILTGTRHQPTVLRFTFVGVCGVFITFLISSSSHAAGDGLFTLANLVNWLHITAGCLWGGTVAVYATTVLPRLLMDTTPQACVAETALRLSNLAGIALLVVLITGILNAWRQLTMLSDLWTSTYGLVLSGKVAVVAVMAAIGALNRFYIVPAVVTWVRPALPTSHGHHASPPHLFLKILRIDTMIFALIMVCASLLSMQEPPYHEDPSHHTQHSHDMPG